MIERRGFLARLAAFAGAAAAGASVAQAEQAAQGWDMSWLDRIKGKHKQVFDLHNTDNGLIIVKNWFETYETVYGLKDAELSAVIGISARGFPINAGDAMYQKFPIGEHYKLNDPETGKPALRNLFLEGGKSGRTAGAGVRQLMARGTMFWMCNNALHNVAGQLAEKVKRPDTEVYEELKAGLNPGVILVPAHTMLLGLCQERGCAYEALY